MDIAGEGAHAITTWDGLVHWGMTGRTCSGVVGLGGRSSRGGRNGGFNGNGAFPISSGGKALGKMTGGFIRSAALDIVPAQLVRTYSLYHRNLATLTAGCLLSNVE